jgi:hypothetical protein
MLLYLVAQNEAGRPLYKFKRVSEIAKLIVFICCFLVYNNRGIVKSL